MCVYGMVIWQFESIALNDMNWNLYIDLCIDYDWLMFFMIMSLISYDIDDTKK